MKFILVKSFICVLGLIIIISFSSARNKETKEQHTYGGASSCKACHLSVKSGAQFKLWASGPHAKAYETLKSGSAKLLAQKFGITDPASSDKCLKCHVTAFGVESKFKSDKLTFDEGVSCEACHGPGSAYKDRKVMQEIYAGNVDGAEYGLVEPKEAVCKKCHNPESPTFKGFNFKEQRKKIVHPVPVEDLSNN